MSSQTPRRRRTQRSYPLRKRRRYSRSYQRRRDIVPRYSGFSLNRMMAGKEYKYIDNQQSYGNISASPYYQLMNGCSAGTTSTTRIGKVTTVVSGFIQGAFYATGSSYNVNIRIMLVIDHQANGNACTISSDILETSAVPLVIQPRGLNNRKRYTIVMDKVFQIGQISDASLPSIGYLRYYHKFRPPVEVNYNAGSGGTVGDIITNSIYCIIFSDGNIGPRADIYTRVRFLDS